MASLQTGTPRSVVVSWTRSRVSMHSPCFPPTVHDSAPPSLHRVPSGYEFPCFAGTMRCSDTLPSIPPHFVSFAWRYPCCTRSSLPSRRVRQDGPGVDHPVPRPGLAVETAGSPRFLENPSVHTPCSPTPAGPNTPGQYGVSARPPHSDNSVGSHDGSFGAQSHGFWTRCLRFVLRVAPARRKTRFRLPAKLYRTGFYP